MEAIESNDKPTVPFDKNTIRYAVEKWMNDREEAIEQYGYISDWNTSAVTDMTGLFAGYDDFNDNINNWDVSEQCDGYEGDVLCSLCFQSTPSVGCEECDYNGRNVSRCRVFRSTFGV